MTRRRRTTQLVDVYDQLAPAVLGYFRSHRMDDPEGLTGDVFVAVAERIRTFDGDDAALRRWVFTIAHHRRVDAIRRARRRPDHVRDDGAVFDRPIEGSSPDTLDEDLVEALGHLTDEQREVVVLRYVADLPIKAVADLTGRSTGAVKMLQQRALETLAGALRPPREDPFEESHDRA